MHPVHYQIEGLSTIRHLNRRDNDGDHHDDHDDRDDHDDHNDHDDHGDHGGHNDPDDHDSHPHSDDNPEASTPSPDGKNNWTTAKKWGYATLANSILGGQFYIPRKI